MAIELELVVTEEDTSFDPLNTVQELITFSSFREGDPEGTRPLFRKSQFEMALDNARAEILDRTKGKTNSEFGERLPIIKEAELYLATSRLYHFYAERLGILSTDANLVGVGNVQLGADTPPPLGLNSKMDFLRDQAVKMHDIGISLLIGKPYSVSIGTEEPRLSKSRCLRSDYWDSCGNYV